MPQASLEPYQFPNRNCEVKKGLIFSEIIAALLEIREYRLQVQVSRYKVFQVAVPFDSVQMILKLSLHKTPSYFQIKFSFTFLTSMFQR